MQSLTNQLKLILGAAALSGALLISGAAGDLRADGCYICSGQSNTYVKFTGNDNGAKRAAAKNCGCTVSGTTGSCNAANYKILCTVMNDKGQKNQSVAAQFAFCAGPKS